MTTRTKVMLVIGVLLIILGVRMTYKWTYTEVEREPQRYVATPTILFPGAEPLPLSLKPRASSVSLVPGGVGSLEDMRARANSDPVLGKLFAGFNWSAARCSTYPEDFAAFVSFRRGARVLWSKKPILIKHGTAYCTDGAMSFLMRCGNLIRMTPAPDAQSEDIPEEILNEPPVLYHWDNKILTAENFPPLDGGTTPAGYIPSVPFFTTPGGPGGFTSTTPTQTPEPSTLSLFVIGALALALGIYTRRGYEQGRKMYAEYKERQERGEA